MYVYVFMLVCVDIHVCLCEAFWCKTCLLFKTLCKWNELETWKTGHETLLLTAVCVTGAGTGRRREKQKVPDCKKKNCIVVRKFIVCECVRPRQEGGFHWGKWIWDCARTKWGKTNKNILQVTDGGLMKCRAALEGRVKQLIEYL